MFQIKKLILSFLILTFVTVITGCNGTSITSNDIENPEKVLSEDLSKYFTEYEGSFVLFDKNKNEYTVYNQQKSQKQVPPCSSFKILNSLIGLETKVLEDENTAFKWDGTKYPIESWNKDHTLKTAISNSVVWYYQKLASQVGEERMQEFLNKVNYGNKDISGGITKFLLQSSLKISPKEQVDMLRKFYYYQLPFSKRNIEIIKNIIVLSDENGIKLSGKTGSGSMPNSNKNINGWFIGYVEKEKDVYIFATNIETNGASDKSAGGQEAKEITLKILKDKSLYSRQAMNRAKAADRYSSIRGITESIK